MTQLWMLNAQVNYDHGDGKDETYGPWTLEQVHAFQRELISVSMPHGASSFTFIMVPKGSTL
jgi:hypothetical protein